MIMNIKIKETNEEPSLKQMYYAYYAKKARVRLGLTLEQASKLVCSLSYMSKFENMLVTPPAKFLKQIERIYGIEFKKVDWLRIETILNSLLIHFLKGDIEPIKEASDAFDELDFSATGTIVKGYYLLMIKDYDGLRKIFIEMKDIVNNISRKEQILLTILKIGMDLSKHQTGNLNLLFTELDNAKITDNYTLWIINYYKAIYAFHLGDIPMFLHSFDTLRKRNYLYNPIDKMMILEMLYVRIIVNEMVLAEKASVWEENVNAFSEVIQDDLFYYKTLIDLRNLYRYGIADAILKKDKQREPRFMALIGICAYVNRVDKVCELFLNLTENLSVKEEDEVHEVFINYLRLKLSGASSDELLDELKYKIFPYTTNHRYSLYDRFYNYEFATILESQAKYKASYFRLKELHFDGLF